MRQVIFLLGIFVVSLGLNAQELSSTDEFRRYLEAPVAKSIDQILSSMPRIYKESNTYMHSTASNRAATPEHPSVIGFDWTGDMFMIAQEVPKSKTGRYRLQFAFKNKDGSYTQVVCIEALI